MQDPAGNAAPAGGFKNLGWYSGYQYVNGTWGSKGSINPNSPQSGAGQPVSSEVNKQSDAAQGLKAGTIDAFVGNTTGSGSAQSVLDQYSQGADTALSGVTLDASKSDEQILAEVRQNLQPSTPQPTPPNLTQTYQGFLASMGVNDLNAQMTTINSQIAAVNSKLEAQQAAEEGTGGSVALGVIAGRETEEQRQAQVQLDSLNLQKGVLTDQINMQMNNINTLMQLTEQDYTNASQAWQTEFDVNSKIYDAFTAQVQERDNLAIEVQKAAATNFQTMANLITSGNIDYNSLPDDAKANIAQMETQAGLPIGTMANIQMSAKDRLLNVSNYRGQVTAILAGADGQITTQTFGSMQPLGLSGATTQKEQAISDMQSQLDSVANSDGNISPQEWQTALNAWEGQGFAKSEFITNFGQYADTNRGDFYQAYGFKNPNPTWSGNTYIGKGQ